MFEKDLEDKVIPLKDILDKSEEIAIEKFNKEGALYPTCLGMSADNKTFLIVLPDLGDRKIIQGAPFSPRQLSFNFLRLVCIKHNINRVAIFHEAWMAPSTAGDDWVGKLDKHPERKEVLMVSASSRTTRLMKTHEIKRENGKVTLENHQEQHKHLSGDLFDVVPLKNPTKEERELAEQGLELMSILGLKAEEI